MFAFVPRRCSPRSSCALQTTRRRWPLAPIFALSACGIAGLALFGSGASAASTTSGATPVGAGLHAAGAYAPLNPGTAVGATIEADETAPVGQVPDGARPSTGSLLVTIPWGSGKGEVGLDTPGEGLVRGPEAFAVAPDGRIAVLDSVNCRLVLMDAAGAYQASVDLSLSAPRFVAVDDESIHVLDADVDDRLVTFDWNGRESSAIDVAFDDVVTALFATTEGPCVEVLHERMVLYPTISAGRADVRRSAKAVVGRPLDGDQSTTAQATLIPGQTPRIRLLTAGANGASLSKTIQPNSDMFAGRKVEHLVSVDGDGRGSLVVGGRLLRQSAVADNSASLLIARVTKTGNVGARLLLTDSSFAYVGPPYVVAPDGRVFQPIAGEAGYSIFIHAL